MHPLSRSAGSLAAFAFCAVPFHAFAQQQPTLVHGSRFQASHAVSQVAAGDAQLVQKLATGTRSAISVVSGDFFQDGGKSLATGYAFGNGGVIAAQKGMLGGATDAAGSSFAQTANFTDVGMRPDFLQAADLNADGQQDLIVATRGGSSVATLLGDGKGGFTLQPAIAAAGPISAVAVWKTPSTAEPLIALGIGGTSPALALYKPDGTLVANIALSSAPTILAIARLNGRAADDIVAGGPAGLSVIDGYTLQSASPRIERLPVSGAVAAATGSFVYDRRYLPQIAVLTQDGSVHTLARTGVIATPPTAADFHVGPGGKGKGKSTVVPVDPSSLSWTDAETLSGVAVPAGGATPLLLRGRISGSGGDDLVALNVNGGIATITHPVVGYSEGENAGKVQVLPARVETESAPAGTTQSALMMRMGVSAAMGLVTASSGAQPEATGSTGKNTFYVNITGDATSAAPPNASNCVSGATGNNTCRLRDAFAAANADRASNETNSTTDTIKVAAGTYTLSYNTGPDTQGSATYHIEIYAPVTVIGTAGYTNTIITAANKDKIFSANSGFNMPAVPLTTFDVVLNGLTLENGTNPNVYNATTAPLINQDGGLFDFETNGGGNLTITSCVLTLGTSPHSGGGALFLSDNIYGNNAGPGNGTLDVESTTISNNKTSELGGGIAVFTNGGGDVPVILNNGDIISGNVANHSVNPSDIFVVPGSGAGVFLGLNSAATVNESTVTTAVFLNNTGTQQSGQNAATGGGLDSENGISVTNSIFAGNSINNSASGGTPGGGGGLYVASYYYASSITGSTIGQTYLDGTAYPGNSVTGSGSDGGATLISTDAASPNAKVTTFQYNRVTGNLVSPAAHTGLALQDPAGASEPVTATYNFWGCNGPAAGAGCDTAGISSGSATLTLSPYAEVTAILNTANPNIGSQLTLTGALNTDSTGAALANLYAFENLPITLTINQNGSPVTKETTATGPSNASASLNYTLTRGGAGTATAQVDNAIATASFTTPSPVTLNTAFGAATIPLNGSTTLTFTLTNPASITQSGIAFTDLLPGGLTGSLTSNTCSATPTTPTASSISFSGGTLAASASCNFVYTVSATTAGVKTNVTSAPTSSQAGTGTPSTASVTVVAPPTVSAAYNSSQVLVNGTTSVVFTLTNPNSIALTGVSLTTNTPSGFHAAGASTQNCGAAPGGSAASPSLSGASIPASSSCTLTVLGTASSTPGTYTDSSGNVTSTEGGQGPGASASINVVAVPTLTLTGPATVNRGATGPTVTATYTVTSGALAPTAQFSLYDGTTLLSSVTATQTSPTTYTATFSTATIPSDSQTVTAQYPGDANYPQVTSSPLTIYVIANNIWIGNPSGTTSALQYNGTALSGSPHQYGGTGVAIDSLGNVWSLNSLSPVGVAKFSSTGTLINQAYAGGGIESVSNSLAIDGAGQVWITNASSSFSELSINGTALSPSTGYTGGNLNNPTGISIDISGNVWIANQGNNSVTEVLGAAAPVVPLAIGVANNTTGSKP